MKRFNKKDYINISILIILFLIIMFSIVGFDKIIGSTIDWNSQHWIIPEYFRNLFYKTRDLFPSFAFNLGAGENIYNLSYYGLLSPITLFSYLLPFISMINYIQIAMLLVVISSVILMYYWLRKRFDEKNSFIGTLLFLLSAPLIFHTHRHIMFISYMPFLLMGLIGVDRYFEKGKNTLLTISVFLIIISSYYYSVGAIICIVMYGIFKYLELGKFEIKKFIIDGLKFLFPVIIGISLSAVLLFPTFYALINGRSDITASTNIYKLIIPSLNVDQVLYNSYSIGLTSIFVLSILWGLFKNKGIRFISIIFSLFLIFPIFTYILSGFMYSRGKVLIPFLPIAILLVTFFLDRLTIKDKKINILFIIISALEIFVMIKINQLYLILDVLILLVTYLLYFKYKNKSIIIYPLFFCALMCCLINNYIDKLETKEYLNNQNNYSNYDRLSMITRMDDCIHRISNNMYEMSSLNRVVHTTYYLPSIYSSLENKNYYNFANNLIGNEMKYRISTGISSDSILFNTFMGVKYTITNNVPIGYTNIIDSDIYYNEDVLPIGFATSKGMSYNDYDKLSYPDNINALFDSIIVDADVESSFKSNMKEEKPKYDINYKNIGIEEKTNGYIINSELDGSIIIDFNKSYKDKLLLVSFDMNYNEKCLVGDTAITINGVRNVLSCDEWTYPNRNNRFEYVISSNDEIDKLNIIFSKGKYEISNIKMYSIDYKYITYFVDSVDEFMIDKKKTIGDNIVGEINVTENGYFMLTIPYEEKGFEIYVDDKITAYEKVDNSFIGFPIHEGNHKIRIKYTSPYLKEGMLVSLISSMILLPLIYRDIFRKKK